MTEWTELKQIQKMGVAALTSSAGDVAEFEIGQLLLDVDNGRIYAIRSEDTTTNSDRIHFWSSDGSISLSFSASSFSDNQSSSQLIGSGAWKAGTALTFTAAYENGPATSANISCGSWAGNLVLSSAYTSGTGGTDQNTNYPAAVANSITFQLNAAKSSESDTATTSVQFLNERCQGVSSTASGYDSTFINALSSKTVTAGKNGTYSFSPSAGEYIIFAHRTALGTSSFAVGGFPGGFEPPVTVTGHTNSAGFSENYYVYRSTNPSLADPTSVVVT